jgi:lipopolysaccharide/colanic/teichoic acid biosynthesis glycosyltransferase
VVDVESLPEPVFKVEDDPRVTRFGRFLRRTSLDELPQLWNVLKGNMSLVGPRPEEERIVARYDENQRRRLKAKPGITGLQQVEARGVTSLDERIRLDVIYIRRRTFLFDLWILARTVLAVLSGRGAR